MEETIDLSTINELLIEQNEAIENLTLLVEEQNGITAGIYTGFLFYIGVASVILVLVLLYKFIRLFF